ncbi:MAG TPA: hypothetical protein VKT77_22210 [Chthonomonadaceae bacterium]|nr:hypothetical protein [Chthonomonadaceae bacterium]
MNQNSDALKAWKWACGAVYFVAALNMVLGWYATSNGTGRIGDIQFNGGVLFGIGLLYAVLGVMTNNRVVAGLWIAAVLFSIDAVLMLIMTIGSGHFGMPMLWVRFALLAAMYRGIPALNQMKQAAVTPASPSPANDLRPATPTMTGYQAPPSAPAGPKATAMTGYQPMRGPAVPEVPPIMRYEAPRAPEIPPMGGCQTPRT